MIIIGIFLLCGIVIFLIWRRKNIHLIEFLPLWLFIASLNQNLADITIANLKLIEITKQLEMFWASFLNRILLIPFLILLFIDFYSTMKGFIYKALLFIAFVFLLFFEEKLAVKLGIIKFHDWQTWWSFVGWAIILIITLGCRKFLHYLLRKERT